MEDPRLDRMKPEPAPLTLDAHDAWLCRTVAGGAVLDVACGSGARAIGLARAGAEVTAIDHDAEAVEHAAALREAEHAAVRDRLTFQAYDGAELPVGDGTFDGVVIGAGLGRTLVPEQLLQEAARVLRPGGTLAVAARYGSRDEGDALYVGPLSLAITRLFTVTAIELSGDHLVLTAVVGPTPAHGDLDRVLLEIAEARLRVQDLEVARLLREAGQMAATLGEQERRIKILTKRNARLTADVERHRGHWSWRLAVALRGTFRSPRGLLRLPVELARILVRPRRSRADRDDRASR